MNFIYMWVENHVHSNGFALSPAMKQRFYATRKWPIHQPSWLVLEFIEVYMWLKRFLMIGHNLVKQINEFYNYIYI